MENIPPRNAASPATDDTSEHTAPQLPSRKRSGSGGSILSKFPFMRTSSAQEAKLQQQQGHSPQQQADSPKDLALGARTSPRALAAAISQQQLGGRRRKGSLRKVALLGRGAARDRREREAEAASGIAAATAPDHSETQSRLANTQNVVPAARSPAPSPAAQGLGISGISSASVVSNVAISDNTSPPNGTPTISTTEPPLASPSRSPTSTTDDEDILVMPRRNPSPAHLSTASLTSMSNAFFAKHSSSTSIQRRRSNRGTATSPLSLQGLTTSPLPQPVDEHDYSETEWWGWVILVVTWFVFIIGMGSCLNIWSWAWDVGTTPYASPELEDDPTLPIVGYYPALMILTTIMAWVWVITAWVGMKYFRHAKMTGD